MTNMRPLCRIYALIWMVFLFGSHLAGSVMVRPNTFNFEQVSIETGLSMSKVTAVVQDRRGFLWVGTQDGLNKYDGYRFEVIKYRSENANSLSSNRIKCLLEDRNGQIWIGTDGGGLNLFDPKTQVFRHFRFDEHDPDSLSHDVVRAMLLDKDGQIWVGTDHGLDRLDRKTGKFVHYRRQKGQASSLSHNRIFCLFQDSLGRIWVGTGGGLNLFDPAANGFQHFKHAVSDPSTISSNQITSIFEDRFKNLWVGTYDGGLNKWSVNSGRFLRFQHDVRKPYSLKDDHVTSILEDREGQLWIGTASGLDRFNWATGAFAHITLNTGQGDAQQTTDSVIQTLFQDRSGVFWIGTASRGLLKHERGKGRFRQYGPEVNGQPGLSHPSVFALLEDSSERIWVGTGRGLNVLFPGQPAFVTFLHDPDDPESLSQNEIFCIMESTAGELWVGTDGGGLNRLDLKTGKFRHYRYDPDDPNSLSHDTVWCMLEDSQGRFWVGTQDGLDLFDVAAGTFRHFRNDPANLNSISHNVIWALYEDSNGTIWIGTENGGLNRFEPDGERFVRFQNAVHDPTSLSHDVVLSICENRFGQLFVGTWGGGLNLFQPGRASFARFSEEDGLPNDVIYGILSDDRGHLWLSTNKGVASFDPEQGSVQTFDRKDGLQGLEFNAGAFHKGLSGVMMFGGTNGFNIFHPSDLTNNEQIPNVIITKMELFEKEIARDLEEGAYFEFDHLSNSLSFEFAALDFTDPAKNRFQCLLEGYDEDWRYPKDNFAEYHRIPPGDYLFRVKGSNNDGVWNESGALIRIGITPPFWQRWWFYMVEGFAGVFFFVGIFAFQRNRLKQQEAKALMALDLQRKTEELEEARQLQLSLLPKTIPTIAGYRVAVHMETATEVGGDYYDFVPTDGGLTCAIGDATGHGLHAGTMVAAGKSLFLSHAGEPQPDVILSKISNTLRKMGLRKMFMAMSILKLKESGVSLGAAGMPFALLYRAETERVEPLVIKAMPLGSFPFPYQTINFVMEPGDTLLLSSDGLEERFNRARKMFGSEKVKEHFAKVGFSDPGEIITSLVKVSADWADGHGLEDDVTIVVIKRTG